MPEESLGGAHVNRDANAALRPSTLVNYGVCTRSSAFSERMLRL